MQTPASRHASRGVRATLALASASAADVHAAWLDFADFSVSPFGTWAALTLAITLVIVLLVCYVADGERQQRRSSRDAATDRTRHEAREAARGRRPA